MDKKLEQAINKQMTNEFFSAYLYLSMAAYFDAKNLPGLSHWMKIQEEEERIHAFKLYDYVNDRGGHVVLGAIDKPETDFASIKDVFEKVLGHERGVTVSFNKLYALAQKINDNASVAFLQWFIIEQVEEEKNASDILARLDLIRDDPMGIVMLDQELGARPKPVAPVA